MTAVLQRFGYDADALSLGSGTKCTGRSWQTRQGGLRSWWPPTWRRGIDLPDLTHVILYEPPEETGCISIGRGGRAGPGRRGGDLAGGCVEQMTLSRIAKRYGIQMQEWPLPSDEEVAALVAERVTVLLEAKLRDRDRLQVERMKRFAPLIHNLSQSEEGLALVTMLVDDYYQEMLHARPEQPAGAEEIKPQRTQRTQGGRRRRR